MVIMFEILMYSVYQINNLQQEHINDVKGTLCFPVCNMSSLKLE